MQIAPKLLARSRIVVLVVFLALKRGANAFEYLARFGLEVDERVFGDFSGVCSCPFCDPWEGPGGTWDVFLEIVLAHFFCGLACIGIISGWVLMAKSCHRWITFSSLLFEGFVVEFYH